jgi:hypothetical protein
MRTRTRTRIESPHEAIVVTLDDDLDDERSNTRRRRDAVCCFPACGFHVGSNSAYPTFTNENARCCDRCVKIVRADRLARDHPGFPTRECMHPKDREHACAFTNGPGNMEKWKAWATFDRVLNNDDYPLSVEMCERISASQCLRCAGAFFERCNVIRHLSGGWVDSAHRRTVELILKTVTRMLLPFYHSVRYTPDVLELGDFPPEFVQKLSRSAKRDALRLTQSTIDEHKEDIPSGVYLSMMNSLKQKWTQL